MSLAAAHAQAMHTHDKYKVEAARENDGIRTSKQVQHHMDCCSG